VLLALLRQAAFDYVTDEVFEAVSNAYQTSGGDSQDLKAFNFGALYRDLLSGILKSGIKLRVFIDALNMCDNPNEVLKAIRDASEGISGGIELLVSSTHHVEVHKILSPVVIDTHSSSAAMEIDMITFITREVQDREKHERLLKGQHSAIEDKLIEILCRRAGGMYGNCNPEYRTRMLTIFQVPMGRVTALVLLEAQTRAIKGNC
jgi:hypothetical protein